MSRWIYRDENGERRVVDLTDEESEAVRAAQAAEDEDDDDEDDENDEDDDGPAREADTPEEFERVDKAYRKEMAAIRASGDAADLRLRRQSLERVLADERQSNIAHTRARDLLAAIEQRELRILAERRADRSR